MDNDATELVVALLATFAMAEDEPTDYGALKHRRASPAYAINR